MPKAKAHRDQMFEIRGKIGLAAAHPQTVASLDDALILIADAARLIDELMAIRNAVNDLAEMRDPAREVCRYHGDLG